MYSYLSNSGAPTLGAALQHTRKRLCRQIDYLAMQPDAAFPIGWPALVSVTEAAFRHEESIMELAGYAGLAAHRAENARILSALHHVTPRVEYGDVGIAREAVAALAAVVSTHRYAIGIAPIDLHLHGKHARHAGA